MCLSILKANGEVIPRRSWWPLTVAEKHSEDERKKHAIFDAFIKRRWGKAMSAPKPNLEEPEQEEFERYSDEDETAQNLPDTEDAIDINGNLINQQPVYDKLIDAEVAIHQDENGTIVGKVKRRTLNHDGRTAGTYDDNPYLNTMIYNVEFQDGQVKE